MMNFDTFGYGSDRYYDDRDDYREERRDRDRNDRRGFSLSIGDTSFLERGALRRGLGGYRGKKFNNKETKESRPSFKEKTKQVDGKTKMAMTQAVLDDFVQAYKKNKTDTVELYELLKTDFPAVCKIMTNYFNDKYESIVESMNNVIDLMTTKVFSTALLTIATDKDECCWDDETMDDMAVLISIVLNTSRNKMISETAEIYREIVADVLFPVLRKNLEDDFGISEDAATDLLVLMPKFGKKITNKEIRQYADTFLTWLIAYYEETIACMDAEQQEKLFYRAFPDDANNQTVKVVGQCLSKEAVSFEDDKQAALYKEYITAMYNILNKSDIPEIKMVLKFIVNELVKREAEHKDNPIIFNPDDAAELDNIDTALADFVDKDENARKFFIGEE